MIRYAVLGTLLRAGEPLSLPDIIARIERLRPIGRIAGPLTPKRVADLLRWQVGCGRVRRVGRGWYVAVPTGFSRTSRWRYERWERRFDDFVGASDEP